MCGVSGAGYMSAAAFITTQHQQLLLVCEKHSQGLKAFLQIKGASDGALFHGHVAQVELLKDHTEFYPLNNKSTVLYMYTNCFLGQATVLH